MSARTARWTCACALWLLAPGLGAAQQVNLQVPQGPFYAGSPIALQLTVEGFAEEPPPEARVAPPAHGQLELVDLTPQVSSTVTIVEGQVTRSREVRFVFRYRYLAQAPGRVELGPFVVSQGALRRTTRSVQLEILEVPLSDRLRVQLRLPEKPVYVGETLPVTLEFWLEAELQETLHSYVLRAPAFELDESFQFLDDADLRGEVEVSVETASGRLRLWGNVSQAVAGGRRFAVVTVTRRLLPLEPGEYLLEPATLIVREGTSWQPHLFGRRAASGRELRATDETRTLRVRPLPAPGMPPTFAAAVGRGYTLEVAADRTVVQAGDPIALTLTLRGEGNLERAGFPPLDAEGLLPAAQFRVPEGDVTGHYEAGAKQFTAIVRVLDPSVREIPPLAYSWFDPERGVYDTTHSQPIALSVRPSEVIAAEDVLGAGPEPAAAGATTTDEPSAGPGRALPLSGADLAIERDARRLLRDQRQPPGGPWLPVGLYTGASLLVLAAFLDRRRRDVDPDLLRRRRRLAAELARIRRARELPPDEGLRETARALRRMLVERPEARSDDVEAFLGECDARSYAPEGRRESRPLDPDFHARALALAARIAERTG